jgi:hypothetical protein
MQTSALDTSNSISVTLNNDNGTIDSKEIYIYYKKQTYNVTVEYTINSDTAQRVSEWNTALSTNEYFFNEYFTTNNLELAPKTTSTAVTYDEKTYYKTYSYQSEDIQYNSTYTAEAPTLDGFRLSGNSSQSVVVKNNNTVITFEYTAVEKVMFYFKAVFPEEATGISSDAPLSINEMSVTINTRPAQSVTAQADYGNYRFIGWYKDKACTIPVTNTETYTNIVTSDPSDSNNNNKLLPLASNVDVTYYAKYDYKRGDLTIINTFAEGETQDDSQGFEYIIQGTDKHNSWVNLKVCIVGDGNQTIKDLPIGSYTVTQTGWSWRYDKDTKITQTAVVVSTTPNASVTFTQTMSNTKWLDGNGYLDNNFTTVTTTTTEESN